MEIVPVLNVVTGTLHSNHEFLMNKLIFDDQPAYDKAKDRVADL